MPHGNQPHGNQPHGNISRSIFSWKSSTRNIFSRGLLLFYIVVFVLSFVSTLKLGSSPGGYDGAQVWRVSTTDPQQYKALKKQLSAEVIHRSGLTVDFMVGASQVEEAKKFLASSKLEYTVLTDDVGTQMKAAQSPAVGPLQLGDMKLQSQKGPSDVMFSFQKYHPLREIYGYMDALSKKYSTFVSTEVIGKSLEKRDLKLLKISCGDTGAPWFWIDAGIHAREWVASATALYIIQELVLPERRAKLPEAMRKINFLVLPVLNADGYDFTWSKDRMWRKNRRPGPGNRRDCPGVDLNRNFDMQWGFGGEDGSSGDPCDESYRGTAPDSEPETKVIINYIKKNLPKIKGYVTFHSYSQLIMYSYSYANILPPNHQKLNALGELAARNVQRVTGAKYTVEASAAMYPAAGVSDDWAFQQKIPYVYCVELRDTGKHGFILPPSEIIPTGQDGLEIIKTIAEEVVKLPR